MQPPGAGHGRQRRPTGAYVAKHFPYHIAQKHEVQTARYCRQYNERQLRTGPVSQGQIVAFSTESSRARASKRIRLNSCPRWSPKWSKTDSSIAPLFRTCRTRTAKHNRRPPRSNVSNTYADSSVACPTRSREHYYILISGAQTSKRFVKLSRNRNS